MSEHASPAPRARAGQRPERGTDGLRDRSAESIRLGETARVDTDGGTVDVVQGLPGVPPFDDLLERAEWVSLYGLHLPLAHCDDLYAMKRVAGRPQDLDDVAFLSRLETDEA